MATTSNLLMIISYFGAITYEATSFASTYFDPPGVSPLDETGPRPACRPNHSAHVATLIHREAVRGA